MSQRFAVIACTISLVLTLINTVFLFVTAVRPASAAVAGMNYRELERDRDFRRAVESIVEGCMVDRESISC